MKLAISIFSAWIVPYMLQIASCCLYSQKPGNLFWEKMCWLDQNNIGFDSETACSQSSDIQSCSPMTFTNPEQGPASEQRSQFSQVPYEVRPIPNKGLGLIARVRLPAGSKILIEPPLFSVAMPEMVPGQGFRFTEMASSIQGSFSALEASQQEEYLKLHEVRFPSEETQSSLMTIFRSNAYNTGTSQVGIFPKIARINHSCKPNCGNYWSEKRGERVIFAMRDIEVGEEITVSYIPLLKSIQERHSRLRQYGFTCDCPACQSSESSMKRAKIEEMMTGLEQMVHAPSKKLSVNNKLITKAETVVKMLEEEGLGDYMAKASHYAAVFHQRRGNWKEAKLWAERELEIHRWAEDDSGEAQETTELIDEISMQEMMDLLSSDGSL